MGNVADALAAELRAFFLAYPGAHSKAPWPGHDDLAVRDKTFAYLPAAGEPFNLSVKLPYTGEVALDLPYAAPTGYGLGKSGWVTFTPPEGRVPPIEQLKDWIDESYRAQAPKRFVKELDSR
jgi:predicted DNA-binding protein (MmcQ/YjbR family)